MRDPVEELAELREQTDVVAQVDELARRRMEPVEAVDESGEVTVRLRPDGRVEQVRVGFAWDRSLSAEEVGPTVLSVVATARTTYLEHYAEAIKESEDAGTPRARPAPTGTATVVDALRARLGDRADDPAAAAALVEELLGELVWQPRGPRVVHQADLDQVALADLFHGGHHPFPSGRADDVSLHANSQSGCRRLWP